MDASLCVANYSVVDSHVSPIFEEGVSVGELEMFCTNTPIQFETAIFP